MRWSVGHIYAAAREVFLASGIINHAATAPSSSFPHRLERRESGRVALRLRLCYREEHQQHAGGDPACVHGAPPGENREKGP